MGVAFDADCVETGQHFSGVFGRGEAKGEERGDAVVVAQHLVGGRHPTD